MKQAPYAELSFAEYQGRLKRAQEFLDKAGLRGMLLFNNKNVYYYTGYRRTVATTKVEGVLVLADRPPVMLMPQLTSRYCDKAVWVEDVRFYGGAPHLGYPQTVVALAVDTIKDLGLELAKIGVELGHDIYPDITYGDLRTIMESFPRVQFVDAAGLILKQRNIKTPFEQEIMRKASAIALESFKAGLRVLREGVTEKEILNAVVKSWIDQGLADTPSEGQILVRSGWREEGPEGRYRLTHARPTDYPVRRGEMVLIDGGPAYRGYFTDLMRQGCVGPPSDVLKELFDTSVVGYQKGIELMKPGMKISELTRRSIEAMQKYNPRIEYPLSFVGHHLGLAIHENPWFSLHEESVLEPGMVINFELGAYDIPQWRTLGGFLEDIFLITEDGNENLTADGAMTLWIAD